MKLIENFLHFFFLDKSSLKSGVCCWTICQFRLLTCQVSGAVCSLWSPHWTVELWTLGVPHCKAGPYGTTVTSLHNPHGVHCFVKKARQMFWLRVQEGDEAAFGKHTANLFLCTCSVLWCERKDVYFIDWSPLTPRPYSIKRQPGSAVPTRAS